MTSSTPRRTQKDTGELGDTGELRLRGCSQATPQLESRDLGERGVYVS